MLYHTLCNSTIVTATQQRVVWRTNKSSSWGWHSERRNVQETGNKTNIQLYMWVCGPGSSVGVATELRSGRSGDRIPVGTRFFACPDRPWGPPSLLYNGYRVFPGGKVRPGRAADHSPPSSALVMEEYSYTSTDPLGHTGPVTGSLYLYFMCT